MGGRAEGRATAEGLESDSGGGSGFGYERALLGCRLSSDRFVGTAQFAFASPRLLSQARHDEPTASATPVGPPAFDAGDLWLPSFAWCIDVGFAGLHF